jgi:hypothetical protein
VCNLTSCIKVACDFVSPWGVKRCSELIGDARQLALVRGGKKEDVLQLKNMMLCAWEEMKRWEMKMDTNSEERSTEEIVVLKDATEEIPGEDI